MKQQDSNSIIENLAASDYKYGFSTQIETDIIPVGLNEEIIRLISAKKNEPEWLLEFRLKAFRYWQKQPLPTWAHLDIPEIDFQGLSYYAAPRKNAPQSLDEVDPELLKTFEKSAIIVTGCYAEVEKEFISKMNQRIVVIPRTQKDILTKIPELLKSEFTKNPELAEIPLANFIKSNLLSENLKFLPQDRFKLSTDTFFNHSRSSIKIQDGCANSCTFCRIHIARGNPVSLDAKEVLQRVQNLENSGQMEVVLTGVNLSQYRSKLGEKTIDFADLLEYLNDNTTKINFRISSLYPERVDEQLE